MPLPASWTTVPVVWEIGTIAGNLAQGGVTFTSEYPVTAGGDTYVPEPIKAQVVDGAMEAVSLPSTDDPDITPTGWTYRVMPSIRGARLDSFLITVPAAGGTINLATVVPAGTPTPTGDTYVPTSQKGTPGGVATLDGGGLVPDAQIPPGVARDAEVAAAVAAHEADSTNVHGIANTALLETTAGAQAKANAAAAASVPLALVDAKGDLLVGTAADTVARLPVGANGSLLVPDSVQGSGWRFSTAKYFEGTGSPEGAVTAVIGSRYVDTVATNGAVEWVKAAGAGNVGWRVVYGDTGWRNVAADLSGGWTAAALNIRRANQTVEIRVQDLNAAAAVASQFYALPAGWAPWSGQADPRVAVMTNAGVLRRATIGGTCHLNGYAAADVASFDIVYLISAAQPWYSTLPGVAL